MTTNTKPTTTTFYVGTLARYVLVEAETEDQAREAGRSALFDLIHNNAPINIRTVRPATPDEIELWKWHQEMIEAEGDHQINIRSV